MNNTQVILRVWRQIAKTTPVELSIVRNGCGTHLRFCGLSSVFLEAADETCSQLSLAATRVDGLSKDDILITLPSLFRAFNLALGGCVESLTWDPAFEKFSGLVGALNKLLKCVVLLSDNEKYCAFHRLIALTVKHARQVLGLYSRLTTKLEKARMRCAYDSFLKRVTEDPAIDIPNLGAAICGYVFRRWQICDELSSGILPMHHGPGAVAEEGVTTRSKWIAYSICDEAMDFVPESYFRVLFPLSEDECRLSDSAFSYESGRYGRRHTFSGATASRVIAVPKDFRGPRIIAAEPVLHQLVQQGLKESLVRYIERDSLLRGAVNFTHQDFNRKAAMEGSIDGSLSTIDLTDASDTVRRRHVNFLFSHLPAVRDLLMQAVTRYVEVPGVDGEVEITSYATMGSALCFPMEAIVYACTALCGVYRKLVNEERNKLGSFRGFGSMIRYLIERSHLLVYGDDIIVRSEFAEAVIRQLELAGFKPNRAKCCYKGRFRESCGADCLFGVDVTPLRPRKLPGCLSSELTPVGLLEQVQSFFNRGYGQASLTIAEFLFRKFMKKKTRSGKEGFRPLLITDSPLRSGSFFLNLGDLVYLFNYKFRQADSKIRHDVPVLQVDKTLVGQEDWMCDESRLHSALFDWESFGSVPPSGLPSSLEEFPEREAEGYPLSWRGTFSSRVAVFGSLTSVAFVTLRDLDTLRRAIALGL